MTEKLCGGCQCGKIRFVANSLLDNPHVCHCRMCQKAFGNLFSALVGVPFFDFSWTRGQPSVFRSSEFVERGFCSDCGTPLFFKHDKNKHISISIGAFDNPDKIHLNFQLGMESRLPQVDQLSKLKEYGTTEDNDPSGFRGIKSTNRQHPDHETTEWLKE